MSSILPLISNPFNLFSSPLVNVLNVQTTTDTTTYFMSHAFFNSRSKSMNLFVFSLSLILSPVEGKTLRSFFSLINTWYSFGDPYVSKSPRNFLLNLIFLGQILFWSICQRGQILISSIIPEKPPFSPRHSSVVFLLKRFEYFFLF